MLIFSTPPLNAMCSPRCDSHTVSGGLNVTSRCLGRQNLEVLLFVVKLSINMHILKKKTLKLQSHFAFNLEHLLNSTQIPEFPEYNEIVNIFQRPRAANSFQLACQITFI